MKEHCSQVHMTPSDKELLDLARRLYAGMDEASVEARLLDLLERLVAELPKPRQP